MLLIRIFEKKLIKKIGKRIDFGLLDTTKTSKVIDKRSKLTFSDKNGDIEKKTYIFLLKKILFSANSFM